jgi:hypothetical protein
MNEAPKRGELWLVADCATCGAWIPIAEADPHLQIEAVDEGASMPVSCRDCGVTVPIPLKHWRKERIP